MLYDIDAGANTDHVVNILDAHDNAKAAKDAYQEVPDEELQTEAAKQKEKEWLAAELHFLEVCGAETGLFSQLLDSESQQLHQGSQVTSALKLANVRVMLIRSIIGKYCTPASQ